MSYSYSTSAPYSQPVTNIPVNNQEQPYQPVTLVDESKLYPQQKPSSLGVAIKTGVLGGGIGALVSLKNNPIINKAGEVSGDYAVKIYEKYLDSAKDNSKKAYEECKELLNKIDGAKNADELKALLKQYPETVDDIFKSTKKTPEKFMKHVHRWNLSKNKKTIKRMLEASNNMRYQDVKNQIQACWDVESRKLVKAEGVSDKLFDAIKSVRNKAKAKAAGKKALVVGGITAATTFVLHKLLSLRAKATQQNY